MASWGHNEFNRILSVPPTCDVSIFISTVTSALCKKTLNPIKDNGYNSYERPHDAIMPWIHCLYCWLFAKRVHGQMKHTHTLALLCFVGVIFSRFVAFIWCISPPSSELLPWHRYTIGPVSLQWRHNGRDGVSNHQPHDCLLNRLFSRRSKETSKLRVTGLWIPRTNG